MTGLIEQHTTAQIADDLIGRSWPILRRCFAATGDKLEPVVDSLHRSRPFVHVIPGGCTLAPDVLDLFAGQGYLRKTFYELVHVCPRCEDASIIFREVCPECGCAGLERPELIHHFTCAGVFPKEQFGPPDQARCPKCRLQLQFIGVDHEYLLSQFHCVGCGKVASAVPTAGRCLACNHRFPAENVHSRVWYSYEVHEDARRTDSPYEPCEQAFFALACLSEERNHHVGMHLHRMRQYCRRLGYALFEGGHDEPDVNLTAEWCDQLADAVLIHDVGNIAVSRNLLSKPEIYTPAERVEVAKHVGYGNAWLEEGIRQFGGTAILRMAQSIVQYHHERWDGSGYGEGLAARQIPLEARIAGVADVYDAMRSCRSYREALPHGKAVQLLTERAGRGFDPAVVEAFVGHADELREIHDQLD